MSATAAADRYPAGVTGMTCAPRAGKSALVTTSAANNSARSSIHRLRNANPRSCCSRFETCSSIATLRVQLLAGSSVAFLLFLLNGAARVRRRVGAIDTIAEHQTMPSFRRSRGRRNRDPGDVLYVARQAARLDLPPPRARRRHHGGLRDDRVGAGFDFRGEQRRRGDAARSKPQSFEARIRRARESHVGLDLAGVSQRARGSQKRERVQVVLLSADAVPGDAQERGRAGVGGDAIARASSTSRHHDAETVCTCVSGSARASIGPRRATRGSHERDERVGSAGWSASAASVSSSFAGAPQCGRCGCTTPVKAGCANAGRCASHATYGLRSRNTCAARVPGRNAADAPSALAIARVVVS